MTKRVAYPGKPLVKVEEKIFSAEILGKTYISKISQKGISLSIDGVPIFTNAPVEDAQKAQNILGLANHRGVMYQRLEEAAQKKSVEPNDWQEKNNPTVPHTVRLTSEREQTVTRRRKQDDRIFKCLDTEQLQAMKDIDEGFHIISGGIQISKYEPFVPGTGYKGRQGSKADRLRKRYLDWAKAAPNEGFSHAMAMDVISFCKSFRKTDKARRRGRGTAKQNLLRALDAYCYTLGWKQRPN